MTRARTDDNQQEIIDGLRKIGADVQDLSGVGKGCPDLLVSFRNTLYLIEIKNPETHGKLNKLQREWHNHWYGDVYTCWTLDEALRVIGAIE